MFRDKGPGHGRPWPWPWASACYRQRHLLDFRQRLSGETTAQSPCRGAAKVRGRCRAHAAAAAASTPIQWHAAHDAGRRISRTARRTTVPRHGTAERTETESCISPANGRPLVVVLFVNPLVKLRFIFYSMIDIVGTDDYVGWTGLDPT